MRWIEPVDVNISEALLDVAGGRTLVAQTLARRGFTNPQLAAAFLDPERYIVTPPCELPGMLAASSCVAEAIRTGLHIGVWGDFDVDGQTSTTLLVSALRGLGAQVSYHIPVRAKESHGVNVPGLEHLFGQGVEFLITCDTGIDAHEAVEYAHSQNVPVIITDHHDLPAELPQAEAILNSKLVDESHPLGTLPGVGVAYKLVEALYEEVGRTAELESFLDLVALGIVADVALLQGDARYLLQRGLNVLRNTQRVGLQALMEYAQVVPAQIGTTDIGFSIAPRLNALGRLGDANGAVDFLSTTDRARAQLFARSLESMNAQRRLLTEQVFQGAMAQIERDPGLLEFAALVLAQRGWPAGVVGIVASRLVERYNKPVILMTVPEDEPARGSARSIEGCNITAAIAEQADLLLGFGGHPMAAGLAIEQKHIETFRKRLSEAVAGQLGAVALEPQITIDAFVDLASLSLEMVADIDRLAPFGAGNPALVYAVTDLRLERVEAMGRSGEHVRLVVEDTNGQQQSVVWWRGAGWDMPSGRFDLAFTAAKNTFRGKTKLQLEFRDFRIIEETEPEIATLTRKIVDWRDEKNALAQLTQIKDVESDLMIWTEGALREQVAGVGREDLRSAAALVVWTTPVSYTTLKAALQLVQPERVYLFDHNPGMDEREAFLQRLAGLCKYVVSSKAGRIRLQTLAAGMAQSNAAVRMGVAWLEAKGLLQVFDEGEELVLSLVEKGSVVPTTPELVLAALKPLLQESAAFRKYYSQIEPEKLIELK